ncbi:MAG: lycopene cyclase domain-containing protein [Bacteroidetes bacterium]|nr:lycopene cyclase domain-containing protein [Bacteroidota bacterium]
MSLYAWLMLASIVGPLALSFDKKVAFYKWWPSLFAGIAANMFLFILWDSWFTQQNVWAFNESYVWPIRWLSLPLEEWSFFIIVPYASIFIYACLKAYFSDVWWRPKVYYLNLFFIGLCVLGLAFYANRTYTFVNLSIALILLLLHQFRFKTQYMGYFWFAYFVHLIPFLIINGILTGAATPNPVVWYNPNEIIGFRITTIPIEDTIYALTCLLLPISILEAIRKP